MICKYSLCCVSNLGRSRCHWLNPLATVFSLLCCSYILGTHSGNPHLRYLCTSAFLASLDRIKILKHQKNNSQSNALKCTSTWVHEFLGTEDLRGLHMHMHTFIHRAQSNTNGRSKTRTSNKKNTNLLKQMQLENLNLEVKALTILNYQLSRKFKLLEMYLVIYIKLFNTNKQAFIAI